MKSILLLRPLGLTALAVFGFSACKSVKGAFTETPTAVISHRLPAMEISADPGPLAMNDGALPEDAMQVFQGEMQRNILEPKESSTFGYARLIVTKVHTNRTGRTLQAAQVVTMLTPSLAGAPLEWYKTNIEAEVQMMNASGELIGSYTGHGSSNVKVAMYHGYSQTTAPRLADVLALRDALAQIRPQLDSASQRLRLLLVSGGVVNAAESR